MSRQFIKEEILKVSMCMKTCPKVLLLREIHFKTMSHYLTPIRMKKKKKREKCRLWGHRNPHALLVAV